MLPAAAEEFLSWLAVEKGRSANTLAAYRRDDFKTLTYKYFMKYTGIPINFGISVALGFLVANAGLSAFRYTRYPGY